MDRGNEPNEDHLADLTTCLMPIDDPYHALIRSSGQKWFCLMAFSLKMARHVIFILRRSAAKILFLGDAHGTVETI